MDAPELDEVRRLVDEGLAPADLLDVQDFMALTLRPSAMDLLRTLDPGAFPAPQVEMEAHDGATEPEEAASEAA